MTSVDSVINPVDGKYAYIVVPWVQTEHVFNKWIPYTVYSAAEANFAASTCNAELLKLIDGTVVYRVQEKFLYKFRRDVNGPYINLQKFGIYRFVSEDPAILVKPVTSRKEWLPVA